MASSSVSKGNIDNTGPKISSWAIFMLLFTSAKTVGRTKYPFSKPSGRLSPPATKVAPSSIPL